MSNMNHEAFAQGTIQELKFDEIEEVNGAALGLALLAGVAIGTAVVGLVALGHERAHRNAERAEG